MQRGAKHPVTGWCRRHPELTFSGITKPRDFRRGVLCWRYLSSQAVSSQVLSAEANLTDLSRDGAAGIPNSLFQHNKTPRLSSWGFVLALPIFPGRLQPSIVSRSELNFRVRDGNGWTLALISTNCADRSCLRSTIYSIWRKSGDPYRIRTDVKGVRGLCLNHLTNGPHFSSISSAGAVETMVHLQGLEPWTP